MKKKKILIKKLDLKKSIIADFQATKVKGGCPTRLCGPATAGCF